MTSNPTKAGTAECQQIMNENLRFLIFFSTIFFPVLDSLVRLVILS